MKNILSILVLSLIMYSCQEEKIIINTGVCSTPATVVDATAFDGCGYMIIQDDGKILLPIIRFYCGTPPLSDDMLNNPLYNFVLRDQQKVKINYEIVDQSYYNICMSGTPVIITCIEEVGIDSTF